jgi:hypothetical protein
MSIVCDSQRLEFLSQLVVVIEACERNAVALSQVSEWDMLLLTLINRSRAVSEDDELIVASLTHRIVAAVAQAHLGVTCGWKIICGCLDLACRLVVGQPDKSAPKFSGSFSKAGVMGHMEGLSFVMGCLIRQVFVLAFFELIPVNVF